MFRKYLGGNKKLGSSSIVKCKGGKKKQNKKQREADKLLYVTSLRAKTSVPSGS